MKEVTRVEDLSLGRDDWTIFVCVVRKWESKTRTGDNPKISDDFLLVDDQGDSIQAVLRKYLFGKFVNSLDVGKVYTITNFRVMDTKHSYRVSSHNLMIEFIPSSKFIHSEVDNFIIPKYHFQFLQFDELRSKLSNNTYLTDVFGLLTSISPVEDQPVRGSIVKKRVLKLENESGQRISVTLWAEQTTLITEEICQNFTDHLIVAVTSTTVKQFRGDYSLSTTNASKVYINPDVLCIQDFMTKLHNENRSFTMTTDPTRSNNSQIQIEEESKSIEDILSLRSDSPNEVIYVTCNARIRDVDEHGGWYYAACNYCNKKLKHYITSFFCETCNTDKVIPSPRYKIQISVNDQTATTTFVLFNKEAESLIYVQCSELANINHDISVPKEPLPLAIKRIIDTSHKFRLKLNNYNLIRGYENFTVSTILKDSSDGNTSMNNNNIQKEKNLVSTTQESIIITDNDSSSHGNDGEREVNPKRKVHSRNMDTRKKRMI